MSNKIFKECVIIFLLIVAIVFTMKILFFDFITENVEDVIQTQYASSEDVIEVLKDIEKNSENEEKTEDSKSLLKSYKITAEDLKDFVNDKYYEKGKKDPFSDATEKNDIRN